MNERPICYRHVKLPEIDAFENIIAAQAIVHFLHRHDYDGDI